MPTKTELSIVLLRDQLLVNVWIYPDVKEAEEIWAEKLGCVRPNYNVIAARPDQDITKFGLIWTPETREEFLSRGVVRFTPQVSGNG